MRDDLPDWMDVDEEPPARPSRVRRLVALAALPWVLVAVLIARSGAAEAPSGPETAGHAAETSAEDDLHHGAHDDAPRAPADEAAGDPDQSPGSEHGHASPDAPDRAPPGEADDLDALLDDLDLEILAWEGGYRQSPGDGAVVGVAALTARAWLTGLEPYLEVEGLPGPDGQRYAEHLVVEALERPAPGAAVVTFAAVVLSPGDVPDAEVARLAVPIDESGDHPQPAGAPWPLPPPVLELRPPTVEDELDEIHWPAAREALATAGFEDVELLGLQRTAGWPVLATVRRPGHDTDLVVWLRRHLQEFVVAGLPLRDALPSASPSRPGEPTPTERP